MLLDIQFSIFIIIQQTSGLNPREIISIADTLLI